MDDAVLPGTDWLARQSRAVAVALAKVDQTDLHRTFHRARIVFCDKRERIHPAAQVGDRILDA